MCRQENPTDAGRCLPWTGTKGGVFAIKVASTLTLNDDINVDGRGFRGCIASKAYSGTLLCTVPGFYHGVNKDSSAQKGEGIIKRKRRRYFNSKNATLCTSPR